jgi:hypothetical protein
VNKNSNELKKLGAGELALEIRKSMPLLNTQTYRAYLTKLQTSIETRPLNSLQPYNPENGCLTTNLTRMPIHKINFGQGIPSFVFTLTIGKNSAVILKAEDNYLVRLVH